MACIKKAGHVHKHSSSTLLGLQLSRVKLGDQQLQLRKLLLSKLTSYRLAVIDPLVFESAKIKLENHNLQLETNNNVDKSISASGGTIILVGGNQSFKDLNKQKFKVVAQQEKSQKFGRGGQVSLSNGQVRQNLGGLFKGSQKINGRGIGNL